MKKTVLRFGTRAALMLVAVFALTFIVIHFAGENYQVQEVIGYAAIFLSLSFVYLGLRYYRDKVNRGLLSFGQGLKLGMLITLLPAVCFALFDVVYVAVFDPRFYERYEAYYTEHMKSSLSADQLQPALEQLKNEMKTFSNPFVGFILMFITVLAAGLIVTVISTFLLKRRHAAG